jgi:hypothetical protein
MMGAEAARSIGDRDPHDPTIPIKTGSGRPRRDRAGIKGAIFDGRSGGEGREERLAGLRLEPEAEGPALGKEVTRATSTGVKPAPECGERPGGSQDRPGPEVSRRAETGGRGESL